MGLREWHIEQQEDKKETKKEYPPITDNQLLRAVDLIKGIMIFGNEGKLKPLDEYSDEVNGAKRDKSDHKE